MRASTAAGATGALALLKILVVPAGVAATFLFVELTSRSTPQFVAPIAVTMSRRGLYALIVVTDLLMLGVIVFGVPFLAAMNSVR